MPKLNEEKLQTFGDQLINDLLRTGEIQYNADNEHDKHLSNDEREKLKNARYRELIAITNTILEEILRDPRNFLENVRQVEDEDKSVGASKSNNKSSAGDAIKTESQRSMKRATGQTSPQRKRSPNLNGRDNERVTAELVRLAQDQVEFDRQYNLQEDIDSIMDEDPYNSYDYDDYYDFIDNASGYSSVDNTGNYGAAHGNGTQRKINDNSDTCDECDGNGNRPNDGDWDKAADYIRYLKSVLAKIRQNPYNRYRVLENGPRYRYCKGYCPPWYLMRKNLNRQRFDYPMSAPCYRCMLNFNAPVRYANKDGPLNNVDDISERGSEDPSQKPAEDKI